MENEPNTNQNAASDGDAGAAKTYSQEEFDAQFNAGRDEVYGALGVTAETAAAEFEAYKAWKTEQQQSASQKPEVKSDNELSDMKNQVTALTRRLGVIDKGIPADKAERYVRLACAYMDDKTDFNAALGKALNDFPLPTAAPGSSAQFGSSVSGGGKTDTLPDEEKINRIFDSHD